METITSLLTTIANFFSSAFSAIVALLQLIFSTLYYFLYLIVTIVPAIFKVIALGVQLLPNHVVPFFVISIAIGTIKFLVFHSSGLTRNKETTSTHDETVVSYDHRGVKHVNNSHTVTTRKGNYSNTYTERT